MCVAPVQGRAAMSMDLAAVERVVRLSAPASAAPVALLTLKKPDEYVRAMYLPWDELSRYVCCAVLHHAALATATSCTGWALLRSGEQ